MSHGGGGMGGHGGGFGHGMAAGGHQAAHHGPAQEHYQHYQHERHLDQSYAGLDGESGADQRSWIVRLMALFRKKRS